MQWQRDAAITSNRQQADGGVILTNEDSEFLAYLRGFSIFIIVFGHVGGFWFYNPFSQFLTVFVPVFFFISGAVSFNSFKRNDNLLEYYQKRLSGLLIPYYFFCFLCLITFLLVQRHWPHFNSHDLVSWLQITPPEKKSPFPIGQVWFLHTLFYISLISPLFFFLYKKNITLLYTYVSFALILAAYQTANDIHWRFYIFDNNMYKPIIHSIFFIFGFLYFSLDRRYQPKLTLAILLFGIITSCLIVHIVKINISYEYHTFSPDIYYVSGSLSSIALLLMLRWFAIEIINKIRFLKSFLVFLYKHTFSIYLLHSFSIYLVEETIGLKHPRVKSIQYAIAKLSLVLMITCILAIPFTKVTEKVLSFLKKKTVQLSRASFAGLEGDHHGILPKEDGARLQNAEILLRSNSIESKEPNT